MKTKVNTKENVSTKPKIKPLKQGDVSGSICTYPKHPSFDEVKCRTSNEGCSGCKYYR